VNLLYLYLVDCSLPPSESNKAQSPRVTASLALLVSINIKRKTYLHSPFQTKK